MSGQCVGKIVKIGQACSMVSVFMSVLWREEGEKEASIGRSVDYIGEEERGWEERLQRLVRGEGKKMGA